MLIKGVDVIKLTKRQDEILRNCERKWTDYRTTNC